MRKLTGFLYETQGRVARITLNRPQRGNGITLAMPDELAHCVEMASLDPSIHLITLEGVGPGFCGGYDLVESAEQKQDASGERAPQGSCLDLNVQLKNHDPRGVWDPLIDYGMMSRNVKGFMSLFHCEKPVLCKIQGFCVGGGTDLALCSDLIVAEDNAKIGYPPARVWGSPTTAMWVYRIGLTRARRMLFTGDCISGTRAVEWGLATEAAPAAELDQCFNRLVERVAAMPINQLTMMKLLINQTVLSQGLASAQMTGTLFDGIARHTREGYAFQQKAAEAGFKQAVRERDEPFGDFGSTKSIP